MLHPIIKDYVSLKAKDKLEKKYKESKENDIVSRYENFDSNVDAECKAWIIEMSKQANQRVFSTHIPKFIHPDIKQFTNILVIPNKDNDGYIRTGNVPQFMDSFGNAAAMPATDLMSLEIDNIPLYEHLRKETDVAKELIAFLGEEGTTVRKNFMKMLSPCNLSSTDSRARQVFFPTNDKDEYHIITPLMSSPVLYQTNRILNENRKYINNPKNSDARTPQKARDFEKNNKYLEGGYWTLSDTVNINYGGTKPQNISNFNNQVKTIKLLKSLPPQLRYRKIRIPINSFFTDSVYIKTDRYSTLFVSLDTIYNNDRNNFEVKNLRDKLMFSLLEEIAIDIKTVRFEISQNYGDYKGALDLAEYIMLYEDEKRYESNEWLLEISEKFARWFFSSYKKIVETPVSFADAEFRYVRDFALENKEIFVQWTITLFYLI